MTLHIIPINDLQEHEEASTCDCCPSAEIIDGDMIIIHNAYDGRE
jgi:hypothetical protein